jgi:hypothetical protein
MAKVWDDFFPLLDPHLVGCPNETKRTYLASTTADFFARTYLWQDDINAIYLAPNSIEYDLDADGNVEVEDVLSVVLDGQQLERVDFRHVPHERRTETGDPVKYWLHADQTIRVFPIPDRRTTLSVAAVLKPRRDGTGVEDWIYETWADVLVSGTVAQLAMIPGKDWSDVNLATMHKAIFERAITNTRIRASRGVHMIAQQRPFA